MFGLKIDTGNTAFGDRDDQKSRNAETARVLRLLADRLDAIPCAENVILVVCDSLGHRIGEAAFDQEPVHPTRRV